MPPALKEAGAAPAPNPVPPNPPDAGAALNEGAPNALGAGAAPNHEPWLPKPMAGAAAYSASKYGLVGMMQSIREELKRTDIRITNLFLGGVDSSFWDTIDLKVQREKMIQSLEAAKTIWFLCQQPSSGVVSEIVLQPFNHQAI